MKTKTPPMKPFSLRDSLAKTVRLLTKSGVEVSFRGHIPHVRAVGGKVVSLVLPELNDNTPDEVIEALHGFVDHECGHIFYTPFARTEKFAKGKPSRGAIANIVEDIRLEKLLPRDLPGTRDNLERMYDKVMDSYFGGAADANKPGVSESRAASMVMVVALRALAGQKAFGRFMDKHDLWKHFAVIMKRVPDLEARLQKMETFRDVERICEDILAACDPETKKDMQEQQKQQDAKKDEKQQSSKSESSEEQPEEGGGEPSDETSGDEKPDESGDQSGEGDQSDEDGSDGEEQSDQSGDKSDKGEDSDDAEVDGDDAGDGKGKGDGGDEDEESESDNGSPTDTGEDQSDGSEDDGSGDGTGGNKVPLRDALEQLDPACRRALFLHKRRGQSASEIAADLNVSESEARNLVATARRKLHEIMNGGK